MLEFKDVELKDKIWVDELLKYSDFRGCEYSFGNNFIWKCTYNIQICRYKDFYLIKNDDGFFFPAGKGDRKEAVGELKKYAENNGKPLFFVTMDKECKQWLEENYSGEVIIKENRDNFDYIYDYYDLSTLSGKKLHSKRNHINRFKENNWNYESINRDNIEECIQMNNKWCELNNCWENNEDGKDFCAVYSGLKNFFELDFKGGLLRVNGEVNAFTFGEHLNSDTFVVHGEKAFTEVQGTYPTINFEFINHECAGYTYINREEDMGLENLRKAKLSYRPVFFEEKYTALFK